jgi:oligopeptide transport system ATP-binding protein
MENNQSYKTIDYPFTVGEAPSGREVVLSVRDLAISFATDEGRVRAVRGVSFDLYKGETLCIVGESGSGKSVTSKTVMGILGASAHIDSGSITYEGEDLTKIAEDDFHRIRGTRIGMIFQDPLSSLNPIMKIGKQITEVMIINGDHLRHKYNDIVLDSQIKYKNDLRLLELAKEERDFTLKKKNLTKEEKSHAKQAYLDEKARLKPIIAEDKKLYEEKRRVAQVEVRKMRAEIVARHKANEAPILSHLFAFKGIQDMKNAYADFIAEYRRYVSELHVTHKEAKIRALKVMQEVGIADPERRFNQYPFEFSGGMRQRIVIAIALTADPDVLICDEPTTALDVTIQAQILELINRLKAARHMSVIFITHDLGVVANMADRVAVMYAGKIVEYGTANDVFYHPAHPYTWALLSSIPDIDSKERLEAIPGTPPNMLFPPKGDAFALRSKYALGIDFRKEPPMFQISSTHYAASWLLDSRAPEATMPKIVSTRIVNSLKKAGVKDV